MERYRALYLCVCRDGGALATKAVGGECPDHGGDACLTMAWFLPATDVQGTVEAARVLLDACEPCAVGNRHVLVEHLDALANACGLPLVGGR